MIINKIEIENFGKFSGRSFIFQPGFNLISGKNEDGKSTLMAFIKLLFYGNSGGKSTDISKNIRRKYTPWNGAPMSGAAEFEINGEKYRLHKEFKKSASSDKTTVTNLTTGEKYALPENEEAGCHFFNMDLGEFERSVFIGNYGGFSSDASADSLAMRIANLSVSGDENLSQSVVYSRLSDAKEELISKNGKKGLLIDAKGNLENLKYRLEVISAHNVAQQTLMKKISNVKNEISELEQKLENHATIHKLNTAKKDFAVFSALTEHYRKQSDIHKKLADFGLTSKSLPDFIHNCRNLKNKCHHEYYNSSSENTSMISDIDYRKLLEIEKQISVLDADYELINNGIRKSAYNVEQTFKSAVSKRKALSLTALCLFTVAGAATTVIYPAYFWLGILFFVAGLASFGYLRYNLNQKVNSSLHLRFAQQDFENRLRHLSFYRDDLTSRTIDELLSECTQQRQACADKLAEWLSRYGCSTLDELHSKTPSVQSAQYNEITYSLNQAKSRFTEFIAQYAHCNTFEKATMIFDEIISLSDALSTVEHDIRTLTQTVIHGELSPDYVKSQLKVLSEFIRNNHSCDYNLSEAPDQLNIRLREKREVLGELQKQIRIPEISEGELLSEIAEATENVNSLTSRYESLNIALDALEDASAEMRKGLGSLLNQKTSEYLKHMTKGKYEDVLVSRDMNVEARATIGEGYHEWKYLSAGAIDRVYLALRLSATDIIAESHNPLPLFLDDILTQYDDENCKNTLEFLNKYFSESGSVSQILFFTCHNHIAAMAKEIMPEIHETSMN